MFCSRSLHFCGGSCCGIIHVNYKAMRNREAAAQPSHESSPRYELRDRRINAIKTGEGTMKKDGYTQV